MDRLMKWSRERREQILKKRKQAARDKLARFLWKAHNTDNRGLLLKMLIDHPEVFRYTLESGGFKMAYCDVTMHDGYSICGHGLFASDAIKDAIADVVKRQ